MPVSTRKPLGAKPVSVPSAFNDFFGKPAQKTTVPLARTGGVNKGRQQEAAANHTLAVRMLALAMATYMVKLMLGMVKYFLDATLVLLVLGSVAAVAKPGPKNGPVAQALSYAESVVDPLFALIADRGIYLVSAHLRTVASYLGLGQAKTAQ
ncbi:hypothetical protein LPJ72_002437 [Coemansia sp. Benny D160-2]|nr:hypothetical protein LPJ72_002437 [Coemansia sp. Benny D160-2]KAJ2692328.1 hypothetical protein GGH99_001805 [Coemansia sp. RSA 1285]